MRAIMSSRKGGRMPFVDGTAHSLSKFSGMPEASSPMMDQLMDAVTYMSLEGGEREVVRKSNNRALGGGSGKPRSSQSSGDVQISGGPGEVPPDNNWPTLGAGSRRPLGRGNNSRSLSAGRGFQNKSNTPSTQQIPLPLKHGWNWPKRAATSSQPSEEATGHIPPFDEDDDNIENDSDLDELDTDDELLTDEYDSDVSEKSHDSCKNSKWFKDFFENMDKLSLDDVHGPSRKWHCPACKGGPGANDWYQGLQPLMMHAKTKGSNRVKLHRVLVELLDEELRRRGTSVIPAGETFGKWKGLNEMVKDRSIVWPPMVVIMNTLLEQDENDKWLGMGNQELLDYFSSYSAVKARHAYGPQGHRGMSVLIFENSAIGRLHNHFQEQGTDREACVRCPVQFYPRGKRQLYGYMAEKLDLDLFNKHCHGNKAAGLKFETRSYQEMVVNQLRHMSEDNQQLIWFKGKLAKERRRSKALEESHDIVSEKLRKTSKEDRIVKQRSKMHHEQNMEAMDFLEQLHKDELEIAYKTRDAKEENFEKSQQEEREKKKQSISDVSAKGDHSHREEDFVAFVKFQDKEMVEFVSEREKLVKAYEDDKISMKKRYFQEELQLEKDFDAALNQLMNKYSPPRSEKESKSSGQ